MKHDCDLGNNKPEDSNRLGWYPPSMLHEGTVDNDTLLEKTLLANNHP